MPFVRDKILLNDGVLRSFWFIIQGFFKAIGEAMNSGEMLAREIEHNDWLQEPEALEFLKDQQSDCAVIDAACHLFKTQLDDFHKKQLMRNDAMRLWIDKKLAAKP